MRSLLRLSPGVLWWAVLNVGLFLLVDSRLQPVTATGGVLPVLAFLASLPSRLVLLALTMIAATAISMSLTESGTRRHNFAKGLLTFITAVKASAWATRIALAP